MVVTYLTCTNLGFNLQYNTHTKLILKINEKRAGEMKDLSSNPRAH